MNSKLRLLLVVVASALTASNPPRATAASEEAEKEVILALITRMEATWNRGDFRGYMEGFANPDMVFVSRGRLRFFDIRIEMLAPDTAQLISRYQLDRPQNSQDGINTRLMRKRGDKWVIALNSIHAGAQRSC
jgi:hypothetical protein